MYQLFSKLVLGLLVIATLGSCAAKKELASTRLQVEDLLKEKNMAEQKLADLTTKSQDCEQKRSTVETELELRKEQVNDLKEQVGDLKVTLSNQMTQVGDLTVLSKAATDNISETLSQLEAKDNYLKYLQMAKTKTDSLNLALAVNLKSVLNSGLDDTDIEVVVDKTVVMINLSDKMLFKSGKAEISSRADEILGKIAKIIKSRPGLDVMVEGYTDSQPISRNGIKDNWDLSVLRSTSVVRALQEKHGIDPNRLIAAGRGEHNAIASNETAEGRSKNRRTRIIILPELGEFYDLLNPQMVAKTSTVAPAKVPVKE